MLNVYYGDNTRNREKFIFDRIDPGERTILIVPDQYSLRAEQLAFEYLGTDSFLNLMVADFSSLGHKVVSKAGIREDRLIDKYGRHMILSEIIENLSPELTVFGREKNANSFVSSMNDMISGMKRQGLTPKDLEGYFENGEEEGWLGCKLRDICSIYSAYEDAVADKYVDPEDYIRLYGELMSQSEIIRGASIWIYGFDTFTPLNFLIIRKLAEGAASVNVVVTWEPEEVSGERPRDARIILPGEGEGLFALSGYIMKVLEEAADEDGIPYSAVSMDEMEVCDEQPSGLWENPSSESISLVETTGVYDEAERAALYIMKLVRDEGFRFGDIAVICNDTELRGDILDRTLRRWGIPCFADTRRKVLHQPAVSFIMALLEMTVSGIRSDSVITMFKTGLWDIESRDCELVENYISEYRIRSSAWNREFTGNRGDYTPEEMAKLNEIRERTVSFVNSLKDEMGRRNTAGEKIRGLYSFLEDSMSMRDRIAELVDRQRELGLAEAAAETAQSWNIICEVFDQIVRIAGERRLSNETLSSLVSAGFEEMEIGIVPQTGDCVIIGTMQRTRLSSVRALIVTGANEGILPAGRSSGGLLSMRELRRLEEMDIAIAGNEEMARQEEQLAMYRMFSAPREKLYVSCALSDHEGKSIAPAGVFLTLQELLGEEAVSRHIDSCEYIASPGASMPYVADAVREYGDRGEIDDEWLHAIRWYRDNMPERYELLLKGAGFSNRVEPLGEELADEIFTRDGETLYASASRLERYSSCPFMHFMDYGLRVREEREFSVDARDIGTLYHECIMKFSERLTSGEGKGIRGENSPWMRITRQECSDLIGEILQEDRSLNGGVFESGGESEFRMKRVQDVCSDVAWALVCQVRSGSVREMYFEEKFRRETADGDKKTVVTGAIDRLDVIDVEEDDMNPPRRALRIIDYKTGNNSVNPEYFRSGYKLQLTMYMNEALERIKADPAGIYYFKIHDFMEKKDSGGALDDRLRKAYRLEGIVPDNFRTICAMDRGMEQAAAANRGIASEVIPVKYVKKDGCFASASKGTLMGEEEFRELCDETEKQVDRICGEIRSGRIDISPAREKTADADGKRMNACKYCRFRSVCMFDRAFPDCRYRDV